jgi:hypothetical protein
LLLIAAKVKVTTILAIGVSLIEAIETCGHGGHGGSPPFLLAIRVSLIEAIETNVPMVATCDQFTLVALLAIGVSLIEAIETGASTRPPDHSRLAIGVSLIEAIET